MLSKEAEQLALVPPFEPEQIHVQGPEPDTVGMLSSAQRLVVGAEVETVAPAEPQAPSIFL